MIPLSGVTKRLRSLFTTDLPPAEPPILTTQEAEQVFRATIAELPADEQQKRIQKWKWYRRLAKRQGIIEAEHQMDLYYEGGSEKHGR